MEENECYEQKENKQYASGLSTLSTAIGAINFSPGISNGSDISTLSTAIGLNLTPLDNDYYNDIPMLEAGLSTLSTTIGQNMNTNTYLGADISTIRPAYSSLLLDLSTIEITNSAKILGTFGIGKNMTVSDNSNNGLLIRDSSKNVNLTYLSTFCRQVSSFYWSTIQTIPITDSMSRMDFTMLGVNGLSYTSEDASGSPILGGYGSWVSGSIDITPQLRGSSFIFSLPDPYHAYQPTFLRINNTPLAYAGNGGDAANPGTTDQTLLNQNFGNGGNAGILNEPAENGVSIYIEDNITETETLPNIGVIRITAEGGFAGGYPSDGKNGRGGAVEDLSIDLVNETINDGNFGSLDLPGCNANNSEGGFGGLDAESNYVGPFSVLFPTIDNPGLGAGGNGGGGYYGGGAGGTVTGRISETINNAFNAICGGGAGGSTWVNNSIVYNANSGNFSNTDFPPPFDTQYLDIPDAIAQTIFTTNEVGIYGGLYLMGPDGSAVSLQCLNNSLSMNGMNAIGPTGPTGPSGP